MNKGKIFSVALFRENIKRFWSLAAVAFFMYIMSGPFVLMQTVGYNKFFAVFSGRSYLLGILLENHNPGFLFMHLVLPVVSAVAVFSYLNRTNSVGVVHAMPFSRRVLFITNYASGLVLSFVPFLLNWLLCLVIARPGVGTNAVHMSDFLLWLLGSFTIITFAFSMAVLACVVSGNTVISTLSGFAANFVVVVLIVCFCGYAAKFLPGFYSDIIWDSAFYASPWTRTIIEDGLSVWQCIIYLAVAAVIAVVSDILYHVRQLERCGDSYVFDWVQTLIGFIFVFVITSLTGLLFFEGMGIGGYIIGFIIGFITGQMVSLKTLHIFNRKVLRNLIIFAVIMALILAAFSLDVFGFEKRIPKADNVESVEIETRFFPGYYSTRKFNDADDIAAITALHKELQDMAAKVTESISDRNGYDDDRYRQESVTIRYALKNGRRLWRQYAVFTDDLAKSENYLKLLASDEIINSIKLLGELKADEKELYVVYNEYPVVGEPDTGVSNQFTLDLTQEQINELMQAMSYDMIESVAADPRYSQAAVCELELRCYFRPSAFAGYESYYKGASCFTQFIDASEKGEGNMAALFQLPVRSGYSRTIKLLNSYGIIKY